MPLYQFACSDCGHPFEALVARASVDAKEPCPSCGSATVERTFALPARLVTSVPHPATNCAGNGPPCAVPWCGRK